MHENGTVWAQLPGLMERELMPLDAASTDEALMICWREGERRAGDVLVARYIGRVRTYFRRRVNGSEREDLVQETFVRLAGAVRRFEARASFRAYLMSIARRTLQDHLRRGYRRIHAQGFEDDCVGEDPLAERCLLELERHRLAIACLDQLSPELRELISRCYWQDTSARALAHEMCVPAGTLRRQLFEARASMRAHYEHADGGSCAAIDVEQLRRFLSSGPKLVVSRE